MLIKNKNCAALYFFCWVLLFCPKLGFTQFNSWISPGALSKAHQELSGVKNCTLCHSTAQGLPNKKCLDCHKDIANKIKTNSGYHAVQTAQCFQCHNEHKGIDYELLGLKRLQFDHSQTGWSLTGKHKQVQCKQCHTQNRKHAITDKPTKKTTYLTASSNCSSCHRDVHKSKNPRFKRCQDCHHSYNFTSLIKHLRFNHNRETNFPLTGAHKNVQCYNCHTKKVWQPLKYKRCTNCHTDPHKGSFGSNCQKCHSTDSWQAGSNLSSNETSLKDFDHQKTRFPLTGQHRSVTCQRCHGSTIGKIKNFSQCSDCHNNPHGQEFQTNWKAKQCNDCHLTEGWQILSFLHNKDSRYKLTGQHTLVACEKCHQNRTYRWLTRTPQCNVCHQDIHNKQFGIQACSNCHTTAGFSHMEFDHNTQSRFKLEGVHRYVNCQSCHQQGKFRPLSTNCKSCHNDFHQGELGQQCENCHTPTRFNAINFDHNKNSNFKLDGQHQYLNCNQCHQNFKYKLGLKRCADCHNDVHNNSFGKNCERCHNTKTFAMKNNFHDFGEYELKGTHNQLNCLVCHGPNQPVRSLKPQCQSCHQDPHMNSLSMRCQNCHGQNTWLPTQFRHAQTGFELSGAHRFLSCEQCHVNRVFGGLPNECSFCHLKDFAPPAVVPQHAAGNTNCKECHRTYGWRPSKL